MSNIRDKENEGKINSTGEKENKGKINNKSKLLDVFKFSFVQNVKNKTFIILTLVCALMMMIIMPITAYMGSSQSEKRKSSIKRVEIIDDNGFMVNALNLTNKGTKIEAFGNVKFIAIDKDAEEYKKEFNKDKTKLDTLLIHATSNDKGYVLNIYKQEKTKVKDNDIMGFQTVLQSVYKSSRVVSMGIAPEKIALINTPTQTKVKVAGEKERDKESETTVIMMFLFVTVFFIVINGENISTQIVTEKSTKLVEYLLTSIRPLDLVGGKILSAVAISFIQILTMIGSGLASIYVCKKQGIVTSFEGTLNLLNIKDISGNITFMKVLAILAFLIIGFLFYSIIACCLASTVSKLEDLGNVNMIFSMITLVSIYVIIAVINLGSSNGQIIDKVCLLIPFTAVYLAPAYVVISKMTTMWILISLVVQCIILLLFAVFASKIYMSLIMYTGKKITFKQMISYIARMFKNGDKAGEIVE